jgi:ribokinase
MKPIVILGIFVADTAYRAERQPKMGETILGTSFVLGPGGKGSNQSVAAAMAGGKVHFITRLGADAFADIAQATWAKAGVVPEVKVDRESYTGAAYIFIENATGNNAIIVAPGAAGRVSAEDVEAKADLIRSASIFVTQLEQPISAALRALQIARGGGVTTILNPAPAASLPDEMLALCDYVTPNESEAEALTGLPVTSVEANGGRRGAAGARGGRGGDHPGRQGCAVSRCAADVHVPVISAGPVVETTGAGDAFNGGFRSCAGRRSGRDRGGALRLRHGRDFRHPTRHRPRHAVPGEIEALLAR